MATVYQSDRVAFSLMIILEHLMSTYILMEHPNLWKLCQSRYAANSSPIHNIQEPMLHIQPASFMISHAIHKCAK